VRGEPSGRLRSLGAPVLRQRHGATDATGERAPGDPAPGGRRSWSVLIVGERGLFSEGLTVACKQAGFDTLEAVATEEELIAALSEGAPVVAVLDLDAVPQLLPAIAELRRERCLDARIVGLVASRDERCAVTAWPGVDVIVRKDATASLVMRAIKETAMGHVIPHPSAVRTRTGHRMTGDAAFLGRLLTEREYEVLRLLTEGHSNSVIAERLWISVSTVRTHVQSILTKLQVHSRIEAALYALHNALA